MFSHTFSVKIHPSTHIPGINGLGILIITLDVLAIPAKEPAVMSSFIWTFLALLVSCVRINALSSCWWYKFIFTNSFYSTSVVAREAYIVAVKSKSVCLLGSKKASRQLEACSQGIEGHMVRKWTDLFFFCK